MVELIVNVRTLADDQPIAHQHASHLRVRRRQPTVARANSSARRMYNVSISRVSVEPST
jgi:hypothetical protein